VIAARTRVAVVIVSSLSGAAAADSGPPGATPGAAPPLAVDPDQPSLDSIANDAGADRGTVFENALTVPRGRFEVDLRGTSGVGALDLRFGATSTLEVSIEAGLLTGAQATAATTPEFAAGIKDTLVPGRRFRVAVEASVRTVYYAPVPFLPAGATATPAGLDLSLSGSSDQFASLGTVVTGCVDAGCTLRLTGGGQLVYELNNGGSVGSLFWTDIGLPARSTSAWSPRACSAPSPPTTTAPRSP
jgi:hypothetical protein